MQARQLCFQLHKLMGGSDVMPDTFSDMERRFESLRGSGRLPHGRENRGRALNDAQIVAAILGLAATRPSWAGHVAAMLEGLCPVGGVENAFGGAVSLDGALGMILSDDVLRAGVIAVRLSPAECGTNAHGLAVITHSRNGERVKSAFVHRMAVSLHQPGAEGRFDPEKRESPVSRETVLDRRFFDELAKAIAYARAHPSPPVGGGSEYDNEDAELARRKRLGVRPHSRFLNIGVDNQVTWPREETLVAFDKYKLVLMPKTADNVQSVHIDLHAHRLSSTEAMTVINRFLSLLTWCFDQFAIAQDSWSGNPVPVAVPQRNLAFSTTPYWFFGREMPTSEDVLRAIALYREARNAEQNFLVSYAVLNYYKIIEIRHHGFPAAAKWLTENLPQILSQPSERELAAAFLKACGEEEPQIYIYAACRVAVAHASPNRPSDPDDEIELRRLHNAASIMRLLARHFIRKDLGFSDSPFGDRSPEE